MMIASATTFIAIAVVLGVIGYRVFTCGGKCAAAFADVTAALPAGAKVLSTAVGDDHIVVTVEVGGVDRSAHIRPRDAQAARAVAA